MFERRYRHRNVERSLQIQKISIIGLESFNSYAIKIVLILQRGVLNRRNIRRAQRDRHAFIPRPDGAIYDLEVCGSVLRCWAGDLMEPNTMTRDPENESSAPLAATTGRVSVCSRRVRVV